MALGSRRDPYLSFNFLVELEGLLVGGFSEVSGLSAEIEIHDYREGGLNDYVHRLAGPVRYPASLVLKRGITDNQALWLWHSDVRRCATGTWSGLTRPGGSVPICGGTPTSWQWRRWNWSTADFRPCRPWQWTTRLPAIWKEPLPAQPVRRGRCASRRPCGSVTTVYHLCGATAPRGVVLRGK